MELGEAQGGDQKVCWLVLPHSQPIIHREYGVWKQSTFQDGDKSSPIPYRIKLLPFTDVILTFTGSLLPSLPPPWNLMTRRIIT